MKVGVKELQNNPDLHVGTGHSIFPDWIATIEQMLKRYVTIQTVNASKLNILKTLVLNLKYLIRKPQNVLSKRFKNMTLHTQL